MKTHAENMKRKQESLAIVRDCLERSSIAIVTDYRGEGKGLSVAEITELRNKLREAGGEYRIVKNTLTKIALKELGIEGLDDTLAGPTAIAFGYDDPSGVAKAVVDFAKKNKATKLPVTRGGYMDGKVLEQEDLKELADLPSLPELQAKLVGLMIAPHRALMGAMQGNARQIVTVLDAWKKKQEEQG